MRFQENDIAYIVENNLRVTKVRVIRTVGGRCTVSICEGKALRLPEGRLYKTQEEAEKHVAGRSSHILPGKQPGI